MKTKIVTLLLSAALAATVITGCGNTGAETSTETSTNNEQATDTEAGAESTDNTAADSQQSQDSGEKTLPTNFEELIASLHAGQSYAYAPIYEGDNALLVTSYSFDDLDGHQGTYEATIFVEKADYVEKVTTVQSGGTAYPIALADDNSLILNMRNSVVKGYVKKETGKFVTTEESIVDYTDSEDGSYHNYKEGASEITADSSLFDELCDKYAASEVLSFEKAGALSDGTPHIAGAVYAAYTGDDLYNVTNYYVFESETSGRTETPDGVTGLPFEYELNGEDIVFHIGSADDTTEAKFGWDNPSYPTLTFTGDNEIVTLSCLGNENPDTFEAAKYYNNDNNLYMVVKSFDEKTLTGDTYREEKIKAEYVDNAEPGSLIYSVNGVQYTVVSFEDANKEMEYGTDEEFIKDAVGMSRFNGFVVKDNEDGTFYALEKTEYEPEYHVVYMMNEGNIRTLIEENVTFEIKENCEIYLEKFVADGEFSNLTKEFIVGREFKGDNYPGWSADAQDEYYLTKDMLVAISVVDGELYNISQIYVP